MSSLKSLLTVRNISMLLVGIYIISPIDALPLNGFDDIILGILYFFGFSISKIVELKQAKKSLYSNASKNSKE